MSFEAVGALVHTQAVADGEALSDSAGEGDGVTDAVPTPSPGSNADGPAPDATVVPPAPDATLPEPARASAAIAGFATHYGGGPAWGDVANYNGQTLGCGGIYRSEDPTIVAVSPYRAGEWPCGTQLYVCGPVGCVTVTRQDACPGCSANVLDLSESAHQLVCGVGTCRVTIERVR